MRFKRKSLAAALFMAALLTGTWAFPSHGENGSKPGSSKAEVDRFGSLTVILHPEEAIQDGALWKLEKDTEWRKSGEKVEGLKEGAYTVNLKQIPGWDPAPDLPALVPGGYPKPGNGFLDYTYTKENVPQDGGETSGGGGCLTSFGPGAALLLLPLFGLMKKR